MNEQSYWQRRRSRITRRRFVGTAALGAAGIAGAATVGCGGDDDDDEASGGSSPVATASTSAAPTTASAPEQPRTGGVITIARTLEAGNMNPVPALTAGLHTMLNPIYSKLVRTVRPSEAASSSDFTIKDDIAESWEEADLQTYTFHIRPGIKWHNVAPLNGRALVADDVVKCYEHYMAGGAHASSFDLVDKIEAPDEQTVKISLKAPFSLFLETISHSTRHVFAPEAVERSGGLDATPVVGTGPFLFEKWERDTTFTAVRNPDYFIPGLPYLDGFELPIIPDSSTRVASFRSGDLHGLGVGVTERKAILDSSPDTPNETVPAQHSIWNLGLDPKRQPWSDIRVRRAISMASDRQATVDSIYEGSAITGWPIPWGYAQDEPWNEEQLGPWYKYDVKEAKALMEAAGLGDGLKTTLFFFPYNPLHESQIQLFQAEMKANLNIDITLEPMDFVAYAARVQGQDYEGLGWAFQVGASAGIDDFLFKNMHSTGVGNYHFLNDPEIDRVVQAIREEPDEAARKELIKEAFRIDMENVYRPCQPAPHGAMVASPQWHGWTPNLLFRGSTNLGISCLTDSWLSA